MVQKIKKILLRKEELQVKKACLWSRFFFITGILILGACMVLTGCGSARRAQKEQKLARYDTQFFGLFDTVTSIIGYTKDEETFTAYAEMLYDELESYHQLYDIYTDYPGISNIKTVNDNAGIKPVQVDEKIIDMLEEAIEMYGETDGRMNIAMGSVLSLWHEYREAGGSDPEHAKLPPEEELREAAKHMDITKVKIDRENSTVYLEDPEMSLDVGSVGKGYAVEMVCRKLETEGLTSAMISVGGNVRAIGSKPEEAWTVGIQNPDLTSSQTYLHRLGIQDMSLVTSGVYQRFYTVDGKRYHHIIHPDLLMPWNMYASVSILCRDSGMADCLSTAVFNMEPEEGKDFVESLEGVEAMWIYPDGTEEYSSGFKKYMMGE